MKPRVIIKVRDGQAQIVKAPKGLLFIVESEGPRGRIFAASQPTPEDPIIIRA